MKTYLIQLRSPGSHKFRDVTEIEPDYRFASIVHWHWFPRRTEIAVNLREAEIAAERCAISAAKRWARYGDTRASFTNAVDGKETETILCEIPQTFAGRMLSSVGLFRNQ